jgi:hypothetical protein
VFVGVGVAVGVEVGVGVGAVGVLVGVEVAVGVGVGGTVTFGSGVAEGDGVIVLQRALAARIAPAAFAIEPVITRLLR